MDGYVVHGGMGMARGSYARIEDGRGILVYVWEGELWITQEGDSRDRYVGRGGWFRIESDGLTLVSALGAGAEVVFSRPRSPETLGERLGRLWSGWFAPRSRPTTAAL